MAETKPKKASNKFFDVAKPGKSAPSSTSRPVIITNRPVLKDPMVIRVNSDDDESTANGEAVTPSTEMRHKIDVKPLHIDLSEVLAPGAPEVQPAAKKADAPADEPAPEIEKAAETPAPETAPVEEETKAAKPAAPPVESTEVPAEPPEPAAADETPQPTEKAATEPEDSAPTPDVEPQTPPAETTTPPVAAAVTPPAAAEPEPKPDEEPSLDNNDRPILSEKETKAAELAKKQAEEQEKIIASAQFYLPINAVEKRRTKRNLILGTILLVVVVVLTALAAWDAGLFSIPGLHAPTNYL